jgi:hypothetical protein
MVERRVIMTKNPMRLAPPFVIPKYAKDARISQYLVRKPDCREWTARQRRGVFLAFL